MKTYLSVPIIANRSKERAKLMAKAVVEAGHELISPWVLDDLESRPLASLNIFSRDLQAVRGSDMIVADVSQPSTGVGMEVMTAYLHGKRIVLVANRGATITRMLTDMDRTVWVEYEDDDSLASNLQSTLRKVS